MKKVLVIFVLMCAGPAFAYQATLAEKQTVSVDELVSGGVTHVTCENPEPRCILNGDKYGIQYPGQSLAEVNWQETTSAGYSQKLLKQLKDDGFCK